MNVIIISFLLMFAGINVLDAHNNSMTKLEDKLLDMVVDCKACKGKSGIGKERPAFTASLGGQPTISGRKAIVKFDKVILNRRGCYDPKTGIFTAPRTGLYQISVTIMSNAGKKLDLDIAKNDLVLLKMYGPTVHGSTQTANPVLELKSGDKVCVINHGSGLQRIYGNNYSSFSGYYISE